jgi:hypothetical protein
MGSVYFILASRRYFLSTLLLLGSTIFPPTSKDFLKKRINKSQYNQSIRPTSPFCPNSIHAGSCVRVHGLAFLYPFSRCFILQQL